MVFGGRTRTAATARPRRPSDGKNRWVTETDAELYGRPILTEFNGLISSAKGGSGKTSRCEAHVDAQWGHNTRCVGRVKCRQRGTRKGKVVWPGAPRRRPMGDQDSLRRTGEDGKVKFGRDA